MMMSVLLYGYEVWKPTKGEVKKTSQFFQNKCLMELLKVKLVTCLSSMTLFRVQTQVIKIHSDSDDNYNGCPMSLDPISSVTNNNFGDVDKIIMSKSWTKQ